MLHLSLCKGVSREPGQQNLEEVHWAPTSKTLHYYQI